MDNKPLFPKTVIIFLVVLLLLLIIIIGGMVYYVKNPDEASIPGRIVGRFINQKAKIIGQSIYLRTIQDPDKDKDGLSDTAEKEIYNTDPSKFSTDGTGTGDGEYIYNVYKKAFESNDEKTLIKYRQNFDLYKKTVLGLASTSDFFGELSLNNAFQVRSLETYNIYVGMPDEMVLSVKQALDARLKGDYEKSLKLLQEVLKKDEASSIIKYHIGLTYHGMKQYDKALEIYESIVNDSSVRSPLLYNDIASAYYGLGNEERLVYYSNLSIKEFPEDLEQYLKLATYYQDKNQLDKAEQVLNEGLKIEPRYAEYYNQLAIISSLRGDNNKEFELYKKVVTYDLRYAPAHLNLALLYEQFYDRPKDALVEGKIAYELDPSPRHLSYMIVLYNANGDMAKAKEFEGQFLKMNNIDGKSYNDVGYMYLDREDYNKAEFYFRKAIEVMPRLSNAYNNLGIVLAVTNRNKEAFINYKKAIEINPNYANAYSNLGIYYTEEKQYPKAIESFEKAINLNPGLWRPYQSIAYVYRLKNDSVKEKYYYEKAVQNGCKDPAVIERLRVLNN